MTVATRDDLDALLAREEHWTAEEALAVLRSARDDPVRAGSAEHIAVISWARRDIAACRVPPAADHVYRPLGDGVAGEEGFVHGREALRLTGYGQLADVASPGAAERFLGLGCPWLAGLPEPAATVVDLGCGSGLDCEIAAAHVGPAGMVIGVDVRDRLVVRNTAGIRYRRASADKTGLPDGSANLVIANGLPPLLSPSEAPAALGEIRRVLRAAGELRAVVLVGRTDQCDDADVGLVRGRRTGKPLLEDIHHAVEGAGLAIQEAWWRYAPFVDAARHRDEAAVLLVARRAA